MTKKKGTKADPPRTDDGGGGRVTMETVVTDGPTGLARLAAFTRRLLAVPKDEITRNKDSPQAS